MHSQDERGGFIAAAGMGLGGEDDSAVAKVYARNAGLTLPGEKE